MILMHLKEEQFYINSIFDEFYVSIELLCQMCYQV
jgi:hypothetical protein